jgi:uncharacterized protein involved in cysteine biosynthesis
MIPSLVKAIVQLPDPRFRKVLATGLSATVATYVMVYLAVGWGLTGLHVFGIGWADTATDILGGLAVFVITLMLFPAIASVTLSFFLEQIAQAVEARHYPGLPEPRQQGWIEVMWLALRFTAVTVAINLLALPLYFILLFAGIGVGLYYGVNGYLLARDYFEMAAGRRLEPAEVDRLRRRYRLRLWSLGVVLAVLSTIPLLNLLAPLVATAAMVHEVEALRRR